MKIGDKIKYISPSGEPIDAIVVSVVRDRVDLHLDGHPAGTVQIFGARVDGGVVDATTVFVPSEPATERTALTRLRR